MKVHELLQLLLHQSGDAEVRIGDQVESAAYVHASVGGVWKGMRGSVILVANDDETWHDESDDVSEGDDLEVLWPSG